MTFTVPAIHIRPPISPCEVASLKPGGYPTPTRISDNPVIGGYGGTPAPDIETVGPFVLDLKVVVEPKPTQPILPTPIPTSVYIHPPLPVPTGKP